VLHVAAAALRRHVLEDGDEVLAQSERTPDEVGTLAAALDGFDAAEQRAVRARARSVAAGPVQTQQSTAGAPHDSNVVRAGRRTATKHGVERVPLDRPVASGSDRQHVPNDRLRRHGARPPVRAHEQRLIGLGLGDGARLGLK
jgi:hypothetical protein